MLSVVISNYENCAFSQPSIYGTNKKREECWLFFRVMCPQKYSLDLCRHDLVASNLRSHVGSVWPYLPNTPGINSRQHSRPHSCRLESLRALVTNGK